MKYRALISITCILACLLSSGCNNGHQKKDNEPFHEIQEEINSSNSIESQPSQTTPDPISVSKYNVIERIENKEETVPNQATVAITETTQYSNTAIRSILENTPSIDDYLTSLNKGQVPQLSKFISKVRSEAEILPNNSSSTLFAFNTSSDSSFNPSSNFISSLC